MSDKRIPKAGEVWTSGHVGATIINVYPDAVVYTVNKAESPEARTLDDFVYMYDPPEPTVVESAWIGPDGPGFDVWFTDEVTPLTHRLDLMSDGEFRVVKL